MKAAVIIFPGSNCDRDMYSSIENITGVKVQKFRHTDTDLPKDLDFIALPGGFSYGDYLRSGAMSAKSPVMNEVIKAAKRGTYILGVCNGFQILTEAGLLEGALIRNKGLKFVCKKAALEVTNCNSNFTCNYTKGQIIHIPIAHPDGNYYADSKTLKSLEENDQIAFKYKGNPNGSADNIAGIFSKDKRILGMMPHPERATEEITGGTDGRALFEAIMNNFN